MILFLLLLLLVASTSENDCDDARLGRSSLGGLEMRSGGGGRCHSFVQFLNLLPP